MTSKLRQKYKDIWVPTFISSIMGFLYNLIDSYLVSTIAEEAIIAVGLIIPLLIISETVITAITSTVSQKVGQSYGAKLYGRVRKKIAIGLFLSVLINAIIFSLMYFFVDLIYAMFGSGDVVERFFKDYYNIWVYTVIIISFSRIYSSALGAMGKVKTITKVSVVAMAINTVVSYVLINGYLLFPKMEMEGAAIGTVIASLFSLSVYFYLLNRDKYLIYSVKKQEIVVILKRMKDHVYSRLMAGILFPIAFLIIMVIVSYFDKNQVAAFTLAHRFDLLWFMFVGASGKAFTVLGNQSIGRKNYKDLASLYSYTLKIGYFWAFVIFLISIFLNYPIAKVFFTDPKTMEVFAYTLPLTVIIYSFWNVVANANGLVTQLDKPYIGAKIALVRSMSMYIVVPGVFAYLFGYGGLLFGYVLGIVPPFIYALYVLKTKQNVVKFPYII